MDLSLFDLTSSRYFNAAVLLIASVVVAKLVDLLVTRVLSRLVARTRFTFDDRLIAILHRPLFVSIVLFGAAQAVYYLEPPQAVEFYAVGALKSAAVLIWVVALYRSISIIFTGLAVRIVDVTGLGKELVPLMENIAKAVLLAGAAMVLLSVWERDITPILASAGIAGFAVAFAAKDTIANFFGGVSIFMDKPFKIGDYIILDSGERGEVVEIGLRSTKIKTRDDVLISIPNSIIASSKIINESAPQPRFRVRVPISVAYGSNIERVEELLKEIALKNEYVVEKPSPRVRFRRFGDSGLEFELLCWVIEPRYKGRAVHYLNSEIYRRFAEEGIEIPYPKMDVYLYRQGQE
ncbi:MAG: mechanosensitive ion channel family protein [Euryarchaeota archaeon]|nr:mechanosensitive ion channel family protein [Euryarchaeota archaeon]